MKRWKVLVVAVGLACPTLGLGAAAPPISKTPPLVRTNLHGVNLQIREQMVGIRKGLKRGRLTRDQARAWMARLKDVRRQENRFFLQNGRKEITDDQKNQLNSLLNRASGSN